MDEIGLGVVTHPATSQRGRRVPESPGGEIPYPDVNGTAFHMKAFLSDAPGVSTQALVRLWRPVAGDDFYGPPASSGRLNFAKHVEEPGINGMHVACPEVPKKCSDFFLNRTGTSPRAMNNI